MGIMKKCDRYRQTLLQKERMETGSHELGSISHKSRPLCDGGGRSRSRNWSSLRAGLASGGGRSSRGRNRSSSINRLLNGSLVVGAVARDVTGLGALVADLAGGAQGTAVGSSAVAGDVAL